MAGRPEQTGAKTKFEPRLAKRRMVFGERGLPEAEDGKINHLVVWDLNPTAWAGEYQEWLKERGAWELTNPHQGTHV